MSDLEAEMTEASSVSKTPMTTTERVVADVTPPATKRLTIDDVYAADGSINLEAVWPRSHFSIFEISHFHPNNHRHSRYTLVYWDTMLDLEQGSHAMLSEIVLTRSATVEDPFLQ